MLFAISSSLNASEAACFCASFRLLLASALPRSPRRPEGTRLCLPVTHSSPFSLYPSSLVICALYSNVSTMSRHLPSWATLLVAASAIALHKSKPSPSLSALKKLITLILVLNWRALPGVWHVGTFQLCTRPTGMKSELTQDATNTDLFGLIPLLHARIRLRGEQKALAIGKDPFDTRVMSKGYVDLSAMDWNMQ